MTNATFKAKFNSASQKVQTTLGVWVDDVKLTLKLSVTEKTWKSWSTQEDLEIGVEKPGHFMLEHHLHKKATRFQFHSHAQVLDKKVRLTFVHHHGLAFPVTTLEANFPCLVADGNSWKVKQNFHKRGPLVKYLLDRGDVEIEPSFDFSIGDKDAFAISAKKSWKKEYLKATYDHHRHMAELELAKKIDDGGPLKITAIVDVKERKHPSFMIEKEWEI